MKGNTARIPAVFVSLWLGQAVSWLGSELMGFGLGVWIFQRTGSVMLYGLSILAVMGPQIALAPLAGVVVDRFDRRRVLLVEQSGAGVCVLLMTLVFSSSHPRPGVLLVLVALSTCFTASNLTSVGAITTLLVPKDALARANGLVELGFAFGRIGAPAAGGILLSSVGLRGILWIDAATFLFALVMLVPLRLPHTPPGESWHAANGPVRDQLTFGWRYIRARPGLFGLLLLFAAVNTNLAMVQVLITPLVLAFSNQRVLGFVLSIGGVGMLAGSLVMMAWGGPRRKLMGVFGFMLMQGLVLFLGGLRPSAILVAGGAFGFLFASPLVNGCSQTIWQTKVPLELQGRVFSFRSLVALATVPVGYLLAGPLADDVFEPLMRKGGMLTTTVGQLLGVGPGRGVALLFVVLGALSVFFVVLGALAPRLSRVEEELPDAPALAHASVQSPDW